MKNFEKGKPSLSEGLHPRMMNSVCEGRVLPEILRDLNLNHPLQAQLLSLCSPDGLGEAMEPS